MPSSFHRSQQTFVKYFLRAQHYAKSCGYKDEWNHRLKKGRGSKIRSCSSLTSQATCWVHHLIRRHIRNSYMKMGLSEVLWNSLRGTCQGKLQRKWPLIWALKISKEFIRKRGRKRVSQARKQHEQRHGGMKVLVMLGKQQADQTVSWDESRLDMGRWLEMRLEIWMKWSGEGLVVLWAMLKNVDLVMSKQSRFYTDLYMNPNEWRYVSKFFPWQKSIKGLLDWCPEISMYLTSLASIQSNWGPWRSARQGYGPPTLTPGQGEMTVSY